MVVVVQLDFKLHVATSVGMGEFPKPGDLGQEVKESTSETQ